MPSSAAHPTSKWCTRTKFFISTMKAGQSISTSRSAQRAARWAKYFPADEKSRSTVSPPPARRSPQRTQDKKGRSVAATPSSRLGGRIGFQHIERSALRQAASDRVRQKLAVRAKKTQDAYLRETKKHERKLRKEAAKRNNRILTEKEVMRQHFRMRDKARKSFLYENKAQVPVLTSSGVLDVGMMKRLTQGQSVTSASAPLASSKGKSSQTYMFKRQRKANAESDLVSLFESMKLKRTGGRAFNECNKADDANAQRHLLRNFSMVVKKACLSLELGLDIFCAAFLKVFNFSSEAVALWYPTVFLSIFRSRKAKKILISRLRKTVGLSSMEVAEIGRVRALLGALLLVGSLNVEDVIDWTRAEPSLHNFSNLCQKSNLSELMEECRILVIRERLEKYYDSTPSLSDNQEKKLLHEIRCVAELGTIFDETTPYDPDLAASVFAGAWVSTYMKRNREFFRSSILKYKKIFAELFEKRTTAQMFLLRQLLCEASSTENTYLENDPLIDAIKGFINVAAIEAKVILDWHSASFQFESKSLRANAKADLKTRLDDLVKWLVHQDESLPAFDKKASNSVDIQKDSESLSKPVAVTEPVLASESEVPVCMKRALVEIERDKRMGRKNWNSSNGGMHRPGTPIFAEWSPIEASQLTDRMIPSFPKEVREVNHDYKAPRKSLHKSLKKQQVIFMRYNAKRPVAKRRDRKKSSNAKRREDFSK